MGYPSANKLTPKKRMNAATIAGINILLFSASLLDAYKGATVTIPPYGLLRIFLVGIILVVAATWFTNKYQGGTQWTVFWGSMAMTLMLMTPSVFTKFLAVYIFGGILIIFIFYIIYKRKKLNFNLVFFFHACVTLLVLFEPMPVFIAEVQKVNWKAYSESVSRSKSVADLPRRTILPDIYYIVVDGYGRKDVLQAYYDYDNSEFLSYLADTGFVIPEQANVNYPKTALSIVSALNMDYIPNFIQGVDDSAFWWLGTPFLENSRTFKLLESAGYQIAALETDWMITDLSTSNLSRQLLANRMNEFEGFYIRSTPFNIFLPLLNVFLPMPSHETHRSSIQRSFQTLQILSQSTTSPKFVFAHIVTPHPPFVFDSQGNAIAYRDSYTLFDGSDYPGTQSEYKEGYIAQLQYTNFLLRETIQSILANSSPPPIIIIQADHGPGMLSDFDSASNTCLHERFSAFAAYYLPSTDPQQVPENITPVNLFRLVLSTYVFDSPEYFPPVEDRFFFPKEEIRIFQFDELSFEQVNAPCPAP